MTEKKKAWKWCAKYIKLRDAIEDYPVTHDLDIVICRTCDQWLERKSRNSQAGHFISKGTGGSSGIYFDERNIHIQCYRCNKHKQGAPVEYRRFMLKKYGQAIIDELELKHKTNTYRPIEIVGLGEYYRQEYEWLCKEYNLKG